MFQKLFKIHACWAWYRLWNKHADKTVSEPYIRFDEPCVFSSEGGHMSIPCLDKETFEFEQFIKRKMEVPNNIILSAEWCCCGRGVPYLYEFLASKEGKTIGTSKLGEDIFASVETDPIAKKTLSKFLEYLGTLLMSNSTALLPDSGIILCGNILSSILTHIKQDMQGPKETSSFFKGFYSNQCNQKYLETVPIYFTSESDLNLKGCIVRNFA